MRRFFKRTLIVVAVLVLGAVVATQLVLWSDYPRRLVERAAAEAVGLRIETASVETGWGGEAVLRDVRVYVPVSDEPIAVAPTVRARYTSLLWLAVTRDFDLHEIEASGAVIDLRQRPSGRWNAQEAYEIVRARLGREGDGDGKPGEWPAVTLTRARVEVRPLGRPEPIVLEGVTFSGGSPARLDYAWTLELPKLGRATGRVTPQEPWQHEARMELMPEPAWVAAVVGEELPTLGMEATWRGALGNDGVEGVAEVKHVTWGGSSVSGVFAARFGSEGQWLVVQPRGANVYVDGVAEPVVLRRGEVSYAAGEPVMLKDVVVGGLGVRALVNGEVNPRLRTGELRAAWRDWPRGDAIDHHGTASVTLERTPRGRAVQVSVEAEGATPWGGVVATLSGRAEGAAWREMVGRVVAERLQLRRGESLFHLDGLAADVGLAAGRVTVKEMRLPESEAPRRLSAAGWYDLDAKTWELEGLAVAFVLPGAPLRIDGLTAAAKGDAAKVEVERVALRSGGIDAEGVGAYVFAEAEPLSARVTLKQAPIRLGGKSEGEAAAANEARRLTVENLFGELRVRGAASPLDLRGEGELTARALRFVVGGRVDELGDVAMRVEGSIDPLEAKVVAVAPEWLGGRWRMEGNLDRVAGRGRVDLVGEEVSLKPLQAAMAPSVRVEGVGAVSLRIDVPQAEPERFTAEGDFTATGVMLTGPMVSTQAEEVRGRLGLGLDGLRVTELRAQSGDAVLTGDASVPMGSDGVTRVRLHADGWPVKLLDGEAVAAVDGDASLGREAGDAAIGGEAQLRTAWVVRGRDAGVVTVDVAGDARRLELRALEGELLGGTVRGEGAVDVSGIVGSDLTVTWQGVRLGELTPWWRPAEAVEGGMSGTLIVRPTTDPRALGPLMLTMSLNAAETRLRSVPLGDGVAVAYTDGARFVVERFDVEAAGGRVSLWGRVAPQAGAWFAFVSAQAERLDLEVLDRAFAGESERPVVGRLSAEATLSMPAGDWRLANGVGSVRVSESDLVNIPLVGALHQLVNLRLGKIEPSGRGAGDVQIEEGRVILPGFRYQNRGAQFNVAVRIEDVWEGRASPIAGYATASQKLLPELTFFGSLNEAIDVLQKDLTPHRISGTLGMPALRAEPLKSLGAAFGEVLGASPAPREPSPPPPPEEE